jgi:hypothetical protein
MGKVVFVDLETVPVLVLQRRGRLVEAHPVLLKIRLGLSFIPLKLIVQTTHRASMLKEQTVLGVMK